MVPLNKRMTSLLLLGLAAVAGCQEPDEIRQYKAPRVEYPKTRLLGALVPQEDAFWVFKLEGTPEAIQPQEKKFEAFIQSLRFTADAKEPITWSVPDGWQHQAGAQVGEFEARHATFYMRSKDKLLELAVSKLPKTNTVLDNVNRWRGDRGLPKIVAEDELAKVVKKIDVEKVNVVLVDLVGDTSLVKRPAVRRQQAPREPAPVQRDGPPGTPRYRVPDGWERVQPKSPTIQAAAFQAGPDRDAPEVTLSFLRPPQPLHENVKRWCGIVKAAEWTEDDLRQKVRYLPCAGADAPYVDLKGARRLLAVMVDRPNLVWFVRMTGTDAAVGQQRAAFEEFVRSLEF